MITRGNLNRDADFADDFSDTVPVPAGHVMGFRTDHRVFKIGNGVDVFNDLPEFSAEVEASTDPALPPVEE